MTEPTMTMFYCESKDGDAWRPRTTDDGKLLKQGGKYYAGQYGREIRGLTKIDPKHMHLDLDTLQAIYGSK